MMKRYSLLLLACFLWAGAIAQPNVPDDYGYSYTTDTTEGGPEFNWIELENPFPVLGLTDDNFFGPIELDQLGDEGFAFKYYGLTINNVYIGSNGYIQFGNFPVNVASLAEGFPSFPRSGPPSSPNNYIGALLSDITFTDADGAPIPGAKVEYGVQMVGENEAFIVTFTDVPWWWNNEDDPRGYGGLNTFQIVLHENTNAITLNYLSNDGEMSPSYKNPGVRFISRGMENVNGSVGLQFAESIYDPATYPEGAYPRDSSTIHVTLDPNPDYRLNDLQVDWVLDPSNRGLVVGANPSGDPDGRQGTTMQVTNLGTDTAVDVTVDRRVFDARGNQVIDELEEERVVRELLPGESIVVEFTDNLDYDRPANLRVQGSIQLNDDIPGNNSRDAELMIVDTVGTVEGGDSEFGALIGYDSYMIFGPTAWPTIGGIASLNTGVYLQPPYYPARIKEVEIGMALLYQTPEGQDTADGVFFGFTCNIYEDAGGRPGALIQSYDVDPSEYTVNYEFQTGPYMEFAYITLDEPICLEDEGAGLFVSWEWEEPEDLPENYERLDFLVSDNVQTSPRSFRTFEISGGQWAPHRSRDMEDYPIRLRGELKTSDNCIVSVAEKQNQLFMNVGQNYPNPSAIETTIPVEMERADYATLEIFDVNGRRIEARELGYLTPGYHYLTVNTTEYASGVYTYALTTSNGRVSRQFIVAQ